MTTFDAPVLGRLLAPIDDAEALQVVLDGWHLWREPRLARLVDVLSNRLVLTRGAFRGSATRTAQPDGFRRQVSAAPRNSAASPFARRAATERIPDDEFAVVSRIEKRFELPEVPTVSSATLVQLLDEVFALPGEDGPRRRASR